MATTIHIPKTTKRNPLVVAMWERHGTTTIAMKDRRKPRGGARNNQRDYREERY